MSVNDAWKGRRFKTDAYKQYERDLLWLLPKMIIPESPLRVSLSFGLINPLSDIDNPVKPFLDILQKKYKFNDRDIAILRIEKVIVEVGNEYIDFEIDPIYPKCVLHSPDMNGNCFKCGMNVIN